MNNTTNNFQLDSTTIVNDLICMSYQGNDFISFIRGTKYCIHCNHNHLKYKTNVQRNFTEQSNIKTDKAYLKIAKMYGNEL